MMVYLGIEPKGYLFFFALRYRYSHFHRPFLFLPIVADENCEYRRTLAAENIFSK